MKNGLGHHSATVRATGKAKTVLECSRKSASRKWQSQGCRRHGWADISKKTQISTPKPLVTLLGTMALQSLRVTYTHGIGYTRPTHERPHWYGSKNIIYHEYVKENIFLNMFHYKP